MFSFQRRCIRNVYSISLEVSTERSSVREQCKELIALGLMSLSEVGNQLHRLCQGLSPLVDDLFQYFDRQWINGNITKALWNFHELNHRTNNISASRDATTRCLLKLYRAFSALQIAYN